MAAQKFEPLPECYIQMPFLPKQTEMPNFSVLPVQSSLRWLPVRSASFSAWSRPPSWYYFLDVDHFRAAKSWSIILSTLMEWITHFKPIEMRWEPSLLTTFGPIDLVWLSIVHQCLVRCPVRWRRDRELANSWSRCCKQLQFVSLRFGQKGIIFIRSQPYG